MRTLFFTIVSLLCVTGSSFAQPTPVTMVKTAVSVKSYKPGGPGNIKCISQWSLIKNGKNMKLFFYMQNDVRNIPMQLVYKGGNLPIKVQPTDDKYYYSIFTAHLKDILFMDKSSKGYTWSWQGAAKAPPSPLTPVNGQAPKRIKYWITVKVDGASFSTEPNYLDIK